MTFPRHFPFSCRVCTHGRQSFFFLSPTGRMMAVSVPARPPTVCLSIPSSSSQIRSVKSPVGCRYNKIYCSLSLSPPHVGVWVGRSVGRPRGTRPTPDRVRNGGWMGPSAVVSVAHAARSAGSHATTSSLGTSVDLPFPTCKDAKWRNLTRPVRCLSQPRTI